MSQLTTTEPMTPAFRPADASSSLTNHRVKAFSGAAVHVTALEQLHQLNISWHSTEKCKETTSTPTQTTFNIRHFSRTWLQDTSWMFSTCSYGLTRTGSRFQWYFSNCLTSGWNKSLEFGSWRLCLKRNLPSPEVWVFLLAHVCTPSSNHIIEY